MIPRLLLLADVAAAHTRARGVLTTLARAFAGVDDAHDVAVVVRVAADAVAVDHAAFVAAVAAVVRRAGARVLAHGDARLAAARRLDGVHLKAGQSARLARLVLPRGALVGQSRHVDDIDDDIDDVDGGAGVVDVDYVTLAPVFAPGSKPGDRRPRLGFAGLAAAVARAPVPVLALGGLDETHGRPCRRAGAHGVAVISALFAAPNPAHALAGLRAAVSSSTAEPRP